MTLLGVFFDLYPDGVMSLPRALLISAVGFLLVFVILGVIALFVKAMGSGFDRAAMKRSAKRSVTPAPTAANAVPFNAAAQTGTPPAGVPLPENASAGTLTLENVTEEEAAVIMAIVSHRSGVPLNRLRFDSIRLLEEKE